MRENSDRSIADRLPPSSRYGMPLAHYAIGRIRIRRERCRVAQAGRREDAPCKTNRQVSLHGDRAKTSGSSGCALSGSSGSRRPIFELPCIAR
jgi:hypothetical protein